MLILASDQVADNLALNGLMWHNAVGAAMLQIAMEECADFRCHYYFPDGVQ